MSPAPTRAKMLSTTVTVASLQGTKHPSCAIKTTSPVYKPNISPFKIQNHRTSHLSNISRLATHVWTSYDMKHCLT
eukprot:m.310823 g.310823  ORF g.310823 m.310823 type:complete len:76 (+) comp55327_c0_seq1:864-1091(+)